MAARTDRANGDLTAIGNQNSLAHAVFHSHRRMVTPKYRHNGEGEKLRFPFPLARLAQLKHEFANVSSPIHVVAYPGIIQDDARFFAGRDRHRNDADVQGSLGDHEDHRRVRLRRSCPGAGRTFAWWYVAVQRRRHRQAQLARHRSRLAVAAPSLTAAISTDRHERSGPISGTAGCNPASRQGDRRPDTCADGRVILSMPVSRPAAVSSRLVGKSRNPVIRCA